MTLELKHYTKKLAKDLIENSEKQDITSIIDDFFTWLNSRYQNGDSKVTYLTAIRKELTKLGVNDKIVGLVRMPDLTIEKNKQQHKRVTVKNSYAEKRIMLKLSEVKEMINKAKELILSSNKYDVIVGLCLLTGRREAEICLSARFEAVSVSEFVAIFHGQKKKKNEKDFSFVMPLLDTVQNIQSKTEFVQSNFLAYQDEKKFNNSFQSTINKYVRFYFGKYSQDITAHKLRAIYAKYLTIELKALNSSGEFSFYDDDLRKAEYTVNTFYAQILGHNVNSRGATDNYIGTIKIIENE